MAFELRCDLAKTALRRHELEAYTQKHVLSPAALMCAHFDAAQVSL